MESYDVIIIGTGAGGGTLARHLAPSGSASSFSSVAAGFRASSRTG
jgi:flavin-dependent dehydrogenase